MSEATLSPEMTANSLANYVSMRNTYLGYDEAKNIAYGITYYSGMYGVDPLLMTALLETESNFNQASVSSAGAIGIGQIMPGTAATLGVNPYDTMQNIQGACSYMGTALHNFSNWPSPVEAALASYNAGSAAVISHGGVPPYSETQNYVATIRDRYSNLQNMLGAVTVVDSFSYTPSFAASSGTAADYVEYVEQETPVGEVLDVEDF